MQNPLLTTSRPELLDKEGDQVFRSLLYAFFAFGRSLDAARGKFAASAQLTTTQYLILIVLAHPSQKEAMGIAEVAERLYLSGAFVTIEVNKLVAEGFIEKQPNPDDGRRVRLSVTADGVKLLARLAAFQRPVNDALFASLSRDEFQTLARLVTRLASHSDQAIKLAEHIEAALQVERDTVQPLGVPTRLKRSARTSRSRK